MADVLVLAVPLNILVVAVFHNTPDSYYQNNLMVRFDDAHCHELNQMMVRFHRCRAADLGSHWNDCRRLVPDNDFDRIVDFVHHLKEKKLSFRGKIQYKFACKLVFTVIFLLWLEFSTIWICSIETLLVTGEDFVELRLVLHVFTTWKHKECRWIICDLQDTLDHFQGIARPWSKMSHP